MKKRLFSCYGAALIIMFSSLNANAAWFSVKGKIVKSTTGYYYSGCMIALDKKIGGQCPGNWVSLDCNGKYYWHSVETGKKMFAAGHAAAQTGKTVRVFGYDTAKSNGYCVARGIEVEY